MSGEGATEGGGAFPHPGDAVALGNRFAGGWPRPSSSICTVEQVSSPYASRTVAGPGGRAQRRTTLVSHPWTIR